MPDISVEREDVPASRTLVQAINVLGDQGQVGQTVLHSDDGPMSKIGLARSYGLPTPIVKPPHQLGIAVESLGGSEVSCAMIPPQPTRATKGGNATLGRNPGTSQHYDGPDQISQDITDPSIRQRLC
jgi:hypothetical protein